MRKKTLGMVASLTAFIALAVTPAFAQATPTLVDINQEPVVYLDMSSSDFGFSTFTPEFKCPETELRFDMTENPGTHGELIKSRFGGGYEDLCVVTPVNGYYYYFAMENFDTSLDVISQNQIALNDVTYDMEIYQKIGGVLYHDRTCRYGDEEVEGGVWGSGLSLGSFNPTLISGGGCPGMTGHGSFYMADLNGSPVEVVE